ncbi:MAG: HEAT repeat domain-containing protein [Elainellaceae cyanobacterium]
MTDPQAQATDATDAMTPKIAIANLRQTEDLGSRYYAAWWLGRFRVQEPEVVEALIEALTDESDRSPDGGFPLRRNAARALGKLGDRQAVSPLIDSLQCDDYYVREAAAQALEELGDPAAISALLQLLRGGVDDTAMIPGKPHLKQPYDAVLEALGTLRAESGVDQIQPFVEHPVAQIQFAAARAMYQITGHQTYGDRLTQALQNPDLQLRRSALMDLGAIGYGPAAEAIAKTLAENSLKLISLKGLLEAEVTAHTEPDSPAASLSEVPELSELSDSAIQIMDFMDQLL